jgi:hypothetical protein
VICPLCFGTRTDCSFCIGGLEAPPREPPTSPLSGRNLADFGSAKHPLRCSALQTLATCPWRVVLEFMFADMRDESGPAADTGSAMHAAAAAWHLNEHNVAQAVEAMILRAGEFPLADLDEAASLFLQYSSDPRNVAADVVAIERNVDFVLPASHADPTGAPIVVRGTVDQVRREGGRLLVYDIKTSKRPGRELLDAHTYQIAAYCVGASVYFGQPVHPGSLICPRHYGRADPKTSPGGVFFPFAWGFDDARFILWGIRRIVAAVRSGEVWHLGGAHCRWCPAVTPDVCVPRLRACTDPATMRISLEMAPPSHVTFGSESLDVEV